MPGFEPVTFYMQSERSTTELNRRYDKYSINLQHPVYLKCLPVRFQILYTIQVTIPTNTGVCIQQFCSVLPGFVNACTVIILHTCCAIPLDM